jgi:hypothetical protein
MSEARWQGILFDGRRAEFCYHQSDLGAWATRKIEEINITDTYSPAPLGLTQSQVEALFVELKDTTACRHGPMGYRTSRLLLARSVRP